MKRGKQLISALLAAALALPMITPGRAVSDGEPKREVTGSVSAKVWIDYRQEWDELEARNLQAELLRGSDSLGKVSLTKEQTTNEGGCSFAVSAKDTGGEARIGSALPRALDLSVTGLPRGNYTLRFTGRGYAGYDARFSIDDYSKYIELGTKGGTFALGDVDGNGNVDEADRDALSEALGSTLNADLDRFDLNGDGRIDIIDLAYVNHNAHTAAGAAMVLDTVCLTVQPESGEFAAEDVGEVRTVVTEGRFMDIFQEDAPVSFARSDGSPGKILIPVPLSQETNAGHLQINTPSEGAGAIQDGSVLVEYADGTTETVNFDNTRPAGVQAIARTEGTNVITIALGKRTPVKKITITVTRTEQGYAVVESIRFLKDIVPENVTEPNREVKNLRADAGDGLVELTWNALPNVSGYRVKYWPKDREGDARTLPVTETPQDRVTGLTNLRTYCFTVVPTDGDWEGVECEPIEAVPEPSKAPDRPDMVTVKPLDGKLAVSWKGGKNATYYEVYYTDRADAPVAEYRQFGGRITETGVTVTGLTNGTPYYLYVVAGNEVGRSAPSNISTGTPTATDYSRPAGIPTEGLLDRGKIKTIALAAPGNYDKNAYSADAPFSAGNMIDGDFTTHWTASTNYTNNEHVVVTFTEPVDLYAAIWVPRLDDGYPSNLRAYSVLAWYEGEDGSLDGPYHLTEGIDNGGGSNAEVWTWPNLPNYSSRVSDRFGILPFGTVRKVKQLSLAVEQRDYTQVSLSELFFMEYDPQRCLPDNIAALFVDDLRTRLADGVTQARIDELKTRLASERNYYLNVETLEDELALAQELLNRGASAGVVLSGIQSRSSAADSRKYGQGGSDLQPLGVAAKAGQEITVYAAGIPDGERVTVYATQFNAEASAWRAEMGTLVNGRNILTVPKIGSQSTERGGSLYLTYSGANPEGIRLHVRRATDIPTLELSDWYGVSEEIRRERIGAYVDELSQYVSAQGINNSNRTTKCLNVTEISMPSVLLSVPAAAVLGANGLDRSGKVENLYQNVLAWEDLMHICKTTQGIDKTYAASDMTSRQNIRCMQMFSGAFMYAAGSHIGIGYGSCAGVVSGLPIEKLGGNASANSLFGWGIAHEVGHNMDKLGRAEITNNIYSLMVQTFDGKQNTLPSRLEKSGKYTSVFAKTAQGWAGESNDVFVQLGMYWQLHLAYDGGDSPMDFYNRFFKAWKAGTYVQGMTGLSYDEKVALTASGTAGKDLTEFFTRWGMALSGPVKARLGGYEEESRAIWYLSDQSRRERLKDAPAAAGTLAASAELSGDKTVRVTIQSDVTQGALQGFEIIRDGKPVAFVRPGADGETVYSDVIGSGNHRTYSYQVTAYDILGNRMGSADAGEVRVAYDQTVPSTAYTMSRSGDTVTFRFDQSTSVSGLKLSGAARPAEGSYTVTIHASFTGEDGKEMEKDVTARTGSFDQGNQAVDDADSYLTYFQKPGAGTEDTRIWTYDAKTVTVTGIPAAMADEDIRLVSYAGDDVAFLEGGAVGRLSEAYAYGEDPEDVIAAGTLIVVGTYRGDPRFNTVRLMGRFARTTAEDGVETVYEERPIDGYALLFSEIPADRQVSDISDGLFIFVPNVQKEAELQEIVHCDGVNLLPSQMKAVLSRTDLPEDAGSQRETAETLWISAPGGEDLPVIELKE